MPPKFFIPEGAPQIPSFLLFMEYIYKPEDFPGPSHCDYEEIERETLTRLQRAAVTTVLENNHLLQRDNCHEHEEAAEMIVELILNMESEITGEYEDFII